MLKEITIQLTTRCNLKCPYCFAPKNNKLDITENNFMHFLEFCKNNSPDCIHITGGEPTLHKNFIEILSKLSNIAPLVVYSNLVKRDIFSAAEILEKKDIFFLVNFNAQTFYTKKQMNNIENNIKNILALKMKVAIGHTFYTNNIEEEFTELIKIIQRYKITHFRISQALQCQDTNYGLNKIEIINLYKFVAENIVNWRNKGIKAYFDCPIPFCYIPDSIIKTLLNYGAISKICHPKAFIETDLNVTHCYSTMCENYNKKISEFEDIDAIRKYTANIIKNISANRINKCSTCNYLEQGKICGCPYYNI